MRVRQEDNDREVVLDDDPLGRGGEAAIHAVSGEASFVAKIYHKPNTEYADKLAAMLASPPDDPMGKTGHASIAWPVARLLAAEGEAPGIVGYLMPRIHQGRLIQEFYNPRARLQLCPLFHYRYLLRTAHNLAAAVRALHEHGYIIGDVNESNILVTNQALVTLVDTDSFQVHTSEMVFRCRVGRPEYTPPELQGARFAEFDRGPEHDAFGLAVLIFQLLMQGMHPFAGTYTGEGEGGTIPKRIALGYWPYAERWEVPVKPSPHAPPWDSLPPAVQTLMRRCFEDGHPDPKLRPAAAEWQYALVEAEEELIICAANAQHHYYRGLKECPWCTLTQQQGRDPFPSVEELKKRTQIASKMALPPADAGPVVSDSRAGGVWNRLRSLGKTLPDYVPDRVSWLRHNLENWPRSRWIAAAVLAAILQLLTVMLIQRLARNDPKPGDLSRDKITEERARVVFKPEPITPLRDFRGHSARVLSVAFLPHGKRAISAGADHLLRLWDLQSGDQIRPLKGHTNWVTSVAVFADGRHAISGSADKTLRVWDLDTGKELKKLTGKSWINAIAVSADGTRAVVGNEDHSVVLWDVTTGSILCQLPGHGGVVTTVAMTADGKFAAAGTAQGVINLWDIGETRQVELRQVKAECAVAALAFAPDQRRLVWAGDDHIIHLANMDTGTEVLRLEGHTQRVTALALTPDGLRVLSAGADKTLRLWDLVTGQQVGHADLHEAQVGCLAIAGDGRSMLAGDETALRSWEVPAPPAADNAGSAPTINELSRMEWAEGGGKVDFFAPLPDGKRFLSVEGTDLSVRLLAFGDNRVRCQGHTAAITDVAIARDGKRAFSVSAGDRTFRFWDLETGKELGKIDCTRPPLSAVGLSSSGALALHVDEEQHAIVLWDTEHATAIGQLKGHTREIVSIAVSPDGRRVLSAGRDGTARLWDSATTRELQRFSGFFLDRHCVGFTSDSRYAVLLSGAPVQFLAVWDLETSRMVRYLGNNDSGFVALQMSPWGPLALTSHTSGNLRLWDLVRGEEVCVFKGYTKPPLGFGFAEAGGNVIAAERNARMRTWAVPEGAKRND
jgi:WD40 repeat protein